MTGVEFSRPVDDRHIPAAPLHLVASADECAALARRFALVAVLRLEARIALDRIDEAVTAAGRIEAAVVQSCAVSGADLAVAIDEPIDLRFVRETAAAADEVELDAGDLDEVAYAGHQFDLGEAVAQSLALAIDPYATGPQAEQTREAAGLGGAADTGPFAALKALKRD